MPATIVTSGPRRRARKSARDAIQRIALKNRFYGLEGSEQNFEERLSGQSQARPASGATGRARRRFWGDYMYAFEEAIRATASERAPWYVVPADNEWFTRLVVAAAIVDTVEQLDLAYPTVDAKKNKELQKARAALGRER